MTLGQQVAYGSLAVGLIVVVLAIAHAARGGYLSAPDKYGHPLRPRDPNDTDAWDAWVKTRRLRQAVIPAVACAALGLTIYVLFLS